MARKVFFSFHYARDLWRVNIVRNSAVMEGVSAAGFHDARLWDETKNKGDAAIKKMIDKGLEGTTVTIVLIGSLTANRAYVSYEIERSVARGNGILGIRINNIKDRNGDTDSPGPIPDALIKAGAPIYNWEYGRLSEWIERAYNTANSHL
ncbi:MAG TPA: TIR domain-containing protein [Nitrospira sp.]|nr:TIR domain-containing protein [Nitrospira sp.]